jgi:hypothetical protein
MKNTRKIFLTTAFLLSLDNQSIKAAAAQPNPARLAYFKENIVNGNIGLVKKLLDNGEFSVDTIFIGKHVSQKTKPLNYAIHNPEMAKLLLENKANPSYDKSSYRIAPLLEASKIGQVDTMKLLINFNASVDQCGASYHETPLYEAYTSNQPAAVALLLRNDARAGLNVAAAYQAAVEGGFPEMAKVLEPYALIDYQRPLSPEAFSPSPDSFMSDENSGLSRSSSPFESRMLPAFSNMTDE